MIKLLDEIIGALFDGSAFLTMSKARGEIQPLFGEI